MGKDSAEWRSSYRLNPTASAPNSLMGGENQALALIENLLVNLSPGSLGACKPRQSLAVKLRFNPPRNRLTEAPGDQRAPQGQECFVNVRPLFVAHA
jgi:hypothetical protein